MKICQRSGTTECRAVIYRSGRGRKKVKNEGVRRKRGWMIDARNEDELKSGADLSGYRKGSSTNFLTRSTRGEFATLSFISMQEVVNKVI